MSGGEARNPLTAGSGLIGLARESASAEVWLPDSLIAPTRLALVGNTFRQSPLDSTETRKV
jgi:hypothetical protein